MINIFSACRPAFQTVILLVLATTGFAGDGDAWIDFKNAGSQGQGPAATTVIASLTALAYDRAGTGAERRSHEMNVMYRGSVALAAAAMMSEHLADVFTAHAAGEFSLRSRGDRFDRTAVKALRHLERNVPTMTITVMDSLGKVRPIPLIGVGGDLEKTEVAFTQSVLTVGGDLEKTEVTFTQSVLTDWVTITAPRTMRTDSAPIENILHAVCLLACALETDLIFEHQNGPRQADVNGPRPMIDKARANRAVQPVVYRSGTERVRTLLLRQNQNPTDPENLPILRGLADSIRPSTKEGAEASIIGFLGCVDGTGSSDNSAATGWQVILQIPRRQP